MNKSKKVKFQKPKKLILRLFITILYVFYFYFKELQF